MKFKKFVSAALAGAMAPSLSVSAFAADTTDVNNDDVTSATTDVTGSTQVPTIKVTVPNAGAVVVNPYKLEVTVNSTKVQTQIVSATQRLVSESQVPLQVNVKATATENGNVKLVETSTQGKNANNGTTPAVYMWFEMATAADATTEPTWATAYNAKNANQLLLATATPATTAGGNATPTAVEKANMLELATGTSAAPSYAAFHLAGDANADATWASTDTVDVELVFTFTPVMNTPAATPAA